MGVVAELPPDLDELYAGDYYSSTQEGTGYEDYEATASHSLAWTVLLLEIITAPGDTVLDVGCANGHLLRSLTDRRRLGIEPHSAMAQVATKAGITVVTGDIFDTVSLAPYAGQCDVVTAIAVLEHLTDIRGGLHAMASLLTDRGLMVFEVPMMGADESDPIWLRTSLEHIWYPTEPSLKTLAATQAGFGLVGLPCKVENFGWTYVGFVCRDHERLAEIQELMDRVLLGDTAALTDVREKRLRFLFDVIYLAAPAPEHVLLVPALTADDASLGLVSRLATLLAQSMDSARYLATQLRSHQAALAETQAALKDAQDARDWHHDQSQRWEAEATRLSTP